MRHLLTMILMLSVATSALAQSQNAAMEDMLRQQMQKLSSGKNGQKMGMLLVVGQLMGCTQKQVGKPATDAFYKEMETVGKTVESYCKANRADDARLLVLNTLAAKQNDPVMTSALGCYTDAQAANVAAIGGQKMADDAGRYARWGRDPALAQTEMTNADICRNTPKPAAPVAAPVTPVGVSQ
ncbi:MAG: hypothetical protein V4735_07885 [Pseudomonadota bacterium]